MCQNFLPPADGGWYMYSTTGGGDTTKCTHASTMMLSSTLISAPTNLLFALVAFSALTLQRSAFHTTFDHHDNVVGTSIQRGLVTSSSDGPNQRRAEATRGKTDRAFPSRVACVAEDGTARPLVAGRKRRRLEVGQSHRSVETESGTYTNVADGQSPSLSLPLPTHPTCNTVHELDMNSKSIIALPNDVQRISPDQDGPLRWKRTRKEFDKKEMAIKTLHWRQHFDTATYHRRGMDAIISEQLSSSKRIVKIHIHCGMTTMHPLDDTLQRPSLLEYDLSTFTTEKRIAVAKNLARAVAELHNSTIDNLEESATIIHGGIKPDSFSIIGTKVRLGDFDSARLVVKPDNSTTQEDVHGLGLAIYNIATGLYPQSRQPTIPEADLESKDRFVRAMVAAVNITTSGRILGGHRPSANDIFTLLKDSEGRFCDQRPLFKSDETYKAVVDYFNETAKTFEECLDKAETYRLRIVLSANMAYEGDFLNWFAHSSDAGLLDERTRAVLYAEDENMFNTYSNSTKMEVKKSWEVGKTKWNDASLSGGGRFSYSEEKSGFGQLVSRRGSVLVEEINLAKKEREILLFMDLDVMLLGDPRSFFCGNFDLWGQDASSYVTGPFNSGFLAMRPTSRMIATLELWRGLLESQKEAGSNQRLFNDAVRNATASLGLKHKLLPRQLFPAGRHVLSKKIKTCLGPNVIHGADLIAFHNNWCSEAKKCHKTERARKLGLWKPVERGDIM